MDERTDTTVRHPARHALDVLDGAVVELRGANLWSMAESELLDLRIELAASLARLQSVVLAVTREVDGRGAAVAAGAPSTGAWLRGRLRMHPGAAKAEVELARNLDGPLGATGAALRDGVIGLEQAAAVARVVQDLPRTVDAVTREEGERYLLEQAAQFDSAALHKLGRHLLLALDPERGARLEREEAMQAHHQELTLSPDADGVRHVRGRFGSEDGAFLDTALQALAAPRPGADGTPDHRLPAQRRAEALVQLVKLAVRSGDAPCPGGEPITLTVTTTAEYLMGSRSGGQGDLVDAGLVPAHQRRPAAATLEDGSPLSPETTRRLGCDAWLVAALRHSAGHLLDIGRAARTVPIPLRRALILRDGGCAFPGCGRPPRWCHAHHIWHWAHGGPTALANLVLLCAHHHRAVHHEGWQVNISPRGRPEFRPPPWIDPAQVPRPAWQPPEHIPNRLTEHGPR